jgi:serine/threonine protein kinase
MFQSMLAMNGHSPSLVLGRRNTGSKHVVRAVASPVEIAHCQPEMFEECFVLGELLGCGSFAEVKVATRRDTHEEFAVKTVSKGQNASSSNGLPPEIENWQLVLASEHVTKLEAVYEDDNSYHLVQELCYGGDLQTYLEVRDPTAATNTRCVGSSLSSIVHSTPLPTCCSLM